MRRIGAILSILLILVTGGSLAADDKVDYVRDVRPILARRCYSCHGVLKQQNKLRLDTAALMKRGGDSGPAIEPGQGGESLLIDAVTGANGVKRMPPEGDPLTAEQIVLLKTWIDQGAKAPDEKTPADPRKHWSYQPPVRSAVPTVANPEWSHNPVDAFIAAEHEKRGLKPSDPAPKHLLLRRVYLDLIGLPPTRAELHAFLADTSSDAYEKVVDRLLASPQYGERWGRHWMDVWRYSDWDGYGKEVRESKPHIWRWRDWIIESLNADKGYDGMVLEMLAGDELAPDDPQTLRATGYLVRNWFSFNRHVWLDNTVEHTAKAFLGVTLNCARCHDHMYDPIPQTEYYQFRAFFEPHNVRTDRVPGQADVNVDGLVRAYDANAAATTFLFTRGDDKQPDKDHPLAPAVPHILGERDFKVEPVALAPTAFYPGFKSFVREEALAQAKAELQRAQSAAAAAKQTLDTARQQAAPTEPETLAAVYQAEPASARAEKALATATAALAALHARIAADEAGYSIPPAANAKELALAAGKADRELALRQAEQNVLQAEDQLAAARRALKPNDEKTKKAVIDAEAKLPVAIKARDAAVAALDKPNENYTRFGEVFPATSTGRRLALARWIADRGNPLTARVAVNHLWLRHFGSPLVSTVFDFGLNGKPPTHPALLDWLAVELMDHGWKMKPLHRLIVTSRTYRLSSSPKSEIRNPKSEINSKSEMNPKSEIENPKSADPDNSHYWRANTHRMEAEIVRDSTLHVAGQLDKTLYGPELDQNAGLTLPRRSLYFRSAKEKKMTFLALFDSANPVECYRRTESIVPQQALAMANSPLALAQSRLLARSLSAEVGPNATPEHVTAFLTAAFEQILCRPPTSDERTECETFLAQQTQQFTDLKMLTAFPSGGESTVKPAAAPHKRARENLVHVLLNHNDFLTVR